MGAAPSAEGGIPDASRDQFHLRECHGRPKIIAFREGEDPPSEVGCACGAVTIRWVTQAPACLDEAPEAEK